MLNRVNSVIRIWFDYTRLIYSRRYFRNKISFYKYFGVYSTLNQSGFWLGTIRELMFDLITINASMDSTTFVELVVTEFCLSLVPRVVALRAWCSSLVLYIFFRNVRLWRTFKVCFCILKMPSSYSTARSTFTSVTFKIVVSAMKALANIAVRACVRWHRHMCLTPVLSSSGTNISRSIYGSRAQ